MCGRDDVQGAVGSEFVHGTLKAKTAYIIHDKTTYGQGVAEFFRADAEKKGIKILGFEGTEEKSNFDPILTPLKAKNPDLIYFGGIYEQGAPFFKQAREKGVKGKFLGPDGLDSSDLVKIAGKSVVGMNYTSVAGPVSVYPQAKQFADEYKEKFGKNPEPFAAQAYDATAIALKGIEAAAKGGKAPSREDVSAAIRKVKHTGITGAIEFDDKGDPKKALYFVLQVASDDPEKWGDNKEVKRLTIAAPAAEEVVDTLGREAAPAALPPCLARRMDLPLLVGIFPQVLLDGIILGFMYALIALGYTMVYGVLEFINFAHSEIFVVGAFVGVEILLGLKGAGLLESLPWPLVLLLILVAGMAVSGLLAITVERVAYRPLRASPRLIPLISAIGVSFFLQDLIRLVEAIWRNAFNHVYPTIDALDVRFELTATIDVSVKSLVVIGGALSTLGVLHLVVNRTKIGMAIRAVAEDQAAASLMGINVNRIISLTFLIGGAMGGAAGVLFGVQYGLINPYTGFIPGLKAFTAAVLGGIGNIPGAMVGGLVLGLLEAFAASYLSLLTGGAFGAEYKDIFAFSILILILIFRPKGLLGEVVRERA